jgi:o-succinylbenzoate synthase
MKAPFETSFGTVWERRILLVEVRSDGLSGWGEITAGEGPFYNPETTDTSWVICCDFVVPLALGKTVQNAADLSALLDLIRGHEMTKAALENALWDIEAQRKGVSLATLLGGTRSEIPCGVSIGIQSSPETLVPVIEKELDSGYQRIKIKPGKDLEYIIAVRKRFPNVKLMVDANSAYRLSDAEHLKQFDAYGLMMIEQPLSWDDIFEHVHLQKQIATPVCLDESIHNAGTREPQLSWAPAASSTSSWVASAVIAKRAASRRFAVSIWFRPGVAACSKPASAAPTISPCPRFPDLFCPETFPPASVIGRKTSSSRKWRSARRGRFASQSPRESVMRFEEVASRS